MIVIPNRISWPQVWASRSHWLTDSRAVSPTYAIVLIRRRTDRYGFRCFPPGVFARRSLMASGGQHNFAQSIFQVGGNAGSRAGVLS